MRNDLGLHVIPSPSGKFIFVGTLSADLATKVKATKADVMGGRAFRDADNEIYTWKFPSFDTYDAAVRFAKSKGFDVSEKAKSNPVKMSYPLPVYTDILNEVIRDPNNSKTKKANARALLKRLNKLLDDPTLDHDKSAKGIKAKRDVDTLLGIRRKGNPVKKKFKDLSIGETFIFTGEIDFPFSGIARGPWKKISARGYIRIGETDVYKVGSINAEVIKQNPATSKGSHVKKKRSAKQLANDKRLGKLAKARAKYKRGKNPDTPDIRDEIRMAMIKAKRELKKPAQSASGQWFGFRLRGKSLTYVGPGGTLPLAWTGRNEAIPWKSRRLAVKAIQTMQNRGNTTGYYYGVAPADMTAAQILAEVRKVRGKT